MRKAGHKLDIDLLRDDFEDAEQHIEPNSTERAAAKREKDADYFIDSAEHGLEYLRLGYLFGKTISELRHVLLFRLTDLQTAIQLGGKLMPDTAATYLCASLVTGDEALTKWLAALPTKAYT